MTNPAPSFDDAVQAIQTLRDELRAAFIERDGEIDAILHALLAEEHVLLLGPWGTAKSALTNALALALDGSTYFDILLTKHTVPEEPFGPYNLPKLREGKYERITTGRFPEANVAFLDEIFKSSSAILNAFLTALNERQFDNGGIRQDIPLTMCVGASNELPADEGLGALFDRFLVRRWTRYIDSRSNRRKLLTMTDEPQINATLTADQLAVLRDARKAVDVSGVVDAMLDVGDALRTEEIEVSDRRWRKCVKLIQAAAVLDGRDTADKADLMVLADALWDDPEDFGKIYGALAAFVSPDLQRALQIVDAATELWANNGLDKADLKDPSVLAAVAGVNRDLNKMRDEIEKLDQTGAVGEATARVVEMHQELSRRVRDAVSGSW